MRVTCPHCSAVFDAPLVGLQFCPNCGQQLEVPREEIPPAPVAAPAPVASVPPLSRRRPTAWERRRELGFFRAFFTTLRDSVLSPQTFWPSVDPRGPVGEPLLYAGLVWLGSGLLFLLLELGGGLSATSFLTERPELHGVLERFPAILTGFGAFALYLLAMLFAALSYHLVAIVLGAADNGFGATLRAVAYASGPLLLVSLTCLGVFAFTYHVVLVGMGLRHLQETSPQRAAGIVLVPQLLVCCACPGALFLAAASFSAQLMTGSQ